MTCITVDTWCITRQETEPGTFAPGGWNPGEVEPEWNYLRVSFCSRGFNAKVRERIYSSKNREGSSLFRRLAGRLAFQVQQGFLRSLRGGGPSVPQSRGELPFSLYALPDVRDHWFWPHWPSANQQQRHSFDAFVSIMKPRGTAIYRCSNGFFKNAFYQLLHIP